MALPELPDACPYQWMISQPRGCDTILVQLGSGDPHAVTLGGRVIDLNPYDGEDKIVQLVEQAAWDIWNEMAREIHIRDIIERHWPWPHNQN